MIIKRDQYLNKLIRHKHNDFVKIISGIRRCGKSYLLFNLFKNHLLQRKVDLSHIITIELDNFKDEKYQNPAECYSYVTSRIQDDQMYYLLLDEVQMMDKFVSVLNGFLRIKNLDVYVTGSNSKFLSSDVVTEFRGRGDEIRIYPLSFAEFFSETKGDWYEAWTDYCVYGGMPAIFQFSTAEEKSKYLKDLFKETYMKDIEVRNKIKNNEELEELTNILASNIGSLTNPRKLANTFKSVKKKTLTAPTIKQYLDYLQNAFILHKVLRYDIKGKRYINTPSKYYFADVGLRNACLNFRQFEETHLMENIIYNELNIRGYQVDVGEVEILEKSERYSEKKIEVDFVVNKASKRYYIQSALSMPNEEKKFQEKRSLINIRDAFKKIIITKENTPIHQDDYGITIMGLKDFLLNPNSLEF